MKENLAARLKSLIKDNGLTQAQFAERLGVKQSMVSDWVNAKHSPSKSTLRLIEREFQATDPAVHESDTPHTDLSRADRKFLDEVGDFLRESDEETKSDLRWMVDLVVRARGVKGRRAEGRG